MHLLHISEVLPDLSLLRPRTIDELMTNVRERESLENPDVVVPTKALELTPEGTLAVPTIGNCAFTDWSKSQFANAIGVKWNRWFSNVAPEEQAMEVNRRLKADDGRIRVRTA